MDHQVVRVLRALSLRVSTPRALTVAILAKYGEWAQLQQLRVNPFNYVDAESLRADLVVTELLRKCELPGDKARKYKAAVDTFWACETQNAKTNARLDRFVNNGPYEASDERLCVFIDAWRKKVKSLLKNLPERLIPRFSGGATYADTSKRATPPDKMSNRAQYYPGMADLLPMWWETAWGRTSISRTPRGVRGNVFFTVPKDGTKDRGCAKEASIAVALQLDVGAFLKAVLRRNGIDLKEGQEKHRQLAREASLTGRFATIDLSNASDTLCKNLVKLLLPTDWHLLLSSLRAPFTRVDGTWVTLEKFSSMGNGFTFELETLIFYTLAETCMELSGQPYDATWCYGDDLIVPSCVSGDVLAALKFFGFSPNVNKTFDSGFFRESCGGDYFRGDDVRAVYLDKAPGEPQEWISLANQLNTLGWLGRAARQECLKNIPAEIRKLRGPASLGDLVITDEDTSKWQVRRWAPKGELVDVDYIRVYRPIPKVLPWSHWKPEIQYAGALLGLPSSGVTQRGVEGYKVGYIPMPGSNFLPDMSAVRRLFLES